MATLALRLDRVKGVANVVSQDRIYIRDEAVAVTIEGFENGEESLAPCLQILHGRYVVAEAMITVTPSNDGATATATLNANTRQFVDAFRGCAGETMHQFQLRIFSTTSQKPIAVGVCSVWNFPAGEGEPSNLPSSTEVLSELRDDVDEHVADKSNPHEVTKEQLGLGNVDNTADADKPVSTATQTALNTLNATLGNAITTETNQRTAADASLQAQISAHTTAISANRDEALAAINAESRARMSADSQMLGEFDNVKERVETAVESIAGKQDALDANQLAAVNSGITASKISSVDNLISTLETGVSNLSTSKQDKLNIAQINAINSGIDVYKVAKIAENAQKIAEKADVSAVVAERNRAQVAEANLSSSISSLDATKATKAQAEALEASITGETARATNAEGVLRQSIAAIRTFEVVVAATLPTPGADYAKKLYLIPSANPETANVRDEYVCVYIGETWRWEQVGSTAVTLTLDETVTESSENGVKSRGIWSFVKGAVATMPDGAARPLPKYLHALEFDDTYKAEAEAFYEEVADDAGAFGCSAVVKNGKLYRNYDWIFDDAAEFVVKVSGKAGERFASVGVASVGARLTEDFVVSGKWSKYYKCLPGMTLDGINEKGVVAEINVDGGPKSGWHGDAEDEGIHILAAVRWALDNGETAAEAAAWIADHVIQPTGDLNFHFILADATATYIVENGEAHLLGAGDDKVLTNYALYDAAHAGGGKERLELLAGGADITAAHWTNAYKTGNTWDSDFEDATQHAAAIQQWAAQGATKEAHRGKTSASGQPWWQTVHTSEYDFAAKTMKVAVQETEDWYTFAVDAGGVSEASGGGWKNQGYIVIDDENHYHDLKSGVIVKRYTYEEDYGSLLVPEGIDEFDFIVEIDSFNRSGISIEFPEGSFILVINRGNSSWNSWYKYVDLYDIYQCLDSSHFGYYNRVRIVKTDDGYIMEVN